jgi:uncharacterized protein YbjT (DUF2867 family)
MHVIVAGGHGQIALRLEKLLSEADHQVTGLVRNPDHTADLEEAGASAVVCDLEDTTVEQLAGHLDGADAAVFAAGAGPGSGADRKHTMDFKGSVLLADAAREAAVPRVVQVSSIGAEAPPDDNEVFSAYLRAKADAEDDLRSRDLDWTIVRPGRLTDDAGTGHVRLAPPPVPRGDVTRDDVAAVLAELITSGQGSRRTLVLVEGDTPIRKAVATLAL